MGKHLKVVTWVRWKVIDPFSPDYYSIFTVSILKPSWEYPVACGSVAIRKGRDKVFLRMPYEAIKQTFIIPEVYRSRLEVGNIEALKQAEGIQKQQRTLHQLARLPEGVSLVDTGTGEILEEVRKMLDGGRDGPDTKESEGNK